MEKDYIKDTSDCYLVTVMKIVYHNVPVRAKSKEEAVEIVDSFISEMTDQEIDDRFYADMDWQYEVETFEKAGYNCTEKSLINNEVNNGL